MQKTAPMRRPYQLPLQLPIELQSKSSNSTFDDALPGPFGAFLPPLMEPKFPAHLNLRPRPRADSRLLLRSGKPREVPANFKTVASAQQLSPKNWEMDHVLDLRGHRARNKKGGACSRQILKMRCRQNCLHMIEVTRTASDEILIKFLDGHGHKPRINVPVGQSKRGQIVVEFINFNLGAEKPEQKVRLFAGRLCKRNGFECKINYERIKRCMQAFFKNEPLEEAIRLLNDFEYLYMGMFLLKKNFVDWDPENLDLLRLQKSETRKRKEHFLKFILKKLFKHLNTQNRDFFGDKNKKIIERMKSIFFEGSRRQKFKDPSSNRMENLGKILSSNEGFRQFYNRTDMTQVTKELFDEYARKPMDTLINNHINRFRASMEAQSDVKSHEKVARFVRLIMDLKKKKLKNMWTFREFEQAKDVLDYIMSSN